MKRLECPCCGLPTLPCRVAAVCPVCWWESDPIQDTSEDVSSGHNHGYTLRQARANFHHHGHMYDRGGEIRPLRSESEGRRHLMAYVADVQSGQAKLDADALERLLSHERANWKQY